MSSTGDSDNSINKATADSIANGSQYGSMDYVVRRQSPSSPTTSASASSSSEKVYIDPELNQPPFVGPAESAILAQVLPPITGAAQTPPKPAVRQRTQQKQLQLRQSQPQLKTANKSYDSIAQTKTHTHAKQQQFLQPDSSIIKVEEMAPSIEQQAPPIDSPIRHQEKDRKTPDHGQELVGLEKGRRLEGIRGGEKLSHANKPSSSSSTAGKGALSLPLPTELQLLERPYPKKVLFIVANEFCERFSYYGLRTVLVLYFRSVLGFSDSNSTVSYHLFATLCYLTPILGAILGDSVWGKFKTIFYLSIVYFIGEVVLVVSSVFWDFGNLSIGATFIGLIMIGIGTGGIKPCVSALGGDQFSPNEEKRRQIFFSLFYGAINLGSLISMFLTPMLRSNFHCVQRTDCYPYAFGLPCLLMFVSIVVFLMAKNQYHLVTLPEKNVIVAFCQCCWLALKRKLAGGCCGSKLPPDLQINNQINQSLTDITSSSELSASSSDDVRSIAPSPIAITTRTKSSPLRHKKAQYTKGSISASKNAIESDHHQRGSSRHWLYLAADRFDSKSIGEFRVVLGILLLFVPLPVYWCLFDQQSSLWTLQATRMDGRLFNTKLVIQPDQMSVANPLLLLSAIPLFEIVIYPSLTRMNLLTKPIQRMTAGGLLAAGTFVLSAMIEIRIQQFLPPTEPSPGMANLLLVNGLSECSLIRPMISYSQSPIAANNSSNGNDYKSTTTNDFNDTTSSEPFNVIEPLGFKRVDLLSNKAANHLNYYQLKFKLSSTTGDNQHLQQSLEGQANGNHSTKRVGCPFDPQLNHQLNVAPLPNKSVRLLYLEQGNGKLAYRLFNESLALPPPGKARVRLLYECFGSSSQAEKRQFYLIRLSINDASNSSQPQSKSKSKLQFHTLSRDGQVLISDYLDVDVPENGDSFVLRTDDNLIKPTNNHSILLEPGTRNLIIAHQKDALNLDIKHQLLQDNNYRISLLYQLAPYLLISVSEVMFSITGLEFSYSMAPSNMKSVILGAWSLTTAFGNILTVAVESMHLFSNVVNDFLFYAAIMVLDMILFAIIGFYYKPDQNSTTTTVSLTRTK